MNLYKSISWTLVVVWMAIIFLLSSQVVEKSNDLSKGVTKIIVDTVEKVNPKANFNIRRFNHILRKNAHFFAYLILGILVINALNASGKCGYKSVALTLFICVLYAISDEVHQMFVPGRGPQIKDVFIDSAGTIVGILMYLIISPLVLKR
ncbi:VanZ family protein [Clostridiisalibacter paucivorans]|uniref:VanZ family protein n=1 Tax=Clostridiisalibacter paucivorans TaxID=408753 RepID=UPI00047CC92A|nr:VanZ family protein [Clostridiisalibacter paucivorans]